ncbi:FAD-dependent monooxygenase [Rhodococcus sp. BP-149]|uniref:FAD-dependent monooxygenase n=1 Tax=unclassified Rhodococcus (in: high G+C Gram-positive bacteria) TaxID=192944 RepID=UPI001C9B9370|nr:MULTISPECIES: FAD-dependent monooxygenase [unclassified Rhodococcus (in: high G+C Gram-positive bacteria)]MBY6687742.1 FAD-dependent monooxygenase [Rhodococcus sp. BP-288]MBY6696007.1 FAD-dependent monooxygenase [Rhodococcus sp. BP-188]MBY6700604.1 FAD-dependent monooxygenase [Rhodococcus sp. BP-285]MBY6705001.1 FAD-dependent monooxygenase [Rhodococcus sp. BP-283]MBY6708585.1 FAD-dependent monooxygenase [Rhodococcus sp. BP-241]
MHDIAAQPHPDAPPLVIVGAGPVGLVAALAARHRGLPVVVVEAEPEDRTRPGSRATFVFRESLDLLERIAPGVTEPLVDRSRAWLDLRTTYAGREVYHHRFPPAPRGQFGISLSQRDQEAVLLDRCHAEAVEFRWANGVAQVATDADGATLTLEDASTIRAEYVVAADGARSSVRRCLGIGMDGGRSESSFIIVDVEDAPENPMSLTRSFHYRHPAVGGRNVLMVPFGGGWRLDLECNPGDDVEHFASEPGLSAWITAVAGPGYAERRAWSSVYRFNHSVATSYTDPHARVLLAGEAAHLFPPFGGGRGLNSGIPDAVFEVDAVAEALAAERPAAAADIIARAATERRAAGLLNRDAASAALVHMEGRGRVTRARQRLAALLAPHSERFGKWLDRAPMGPTVPVNSRSRF